MLCIKSVSIKKGNEITWGCLLETVCVMTLLNRSLNTLISFQTRSGLSSLFGFSLSLCQIFFFCLCQICGGNSSFLGQQYPPVAWVGGLQGLSGMHILRVWTSQLVLGVKEPPSQCRRRKRYRLDPWVGKIPRRRAWQPTPGFLPVKFHGQRCLVGYSL